MKKQVLIFGIVIIAFALTAFTIFKNDSKEVTPTQITTTETEDIIYGPLEYEPINKNEVFEDFIYEIGTRFMPIKKSVVLNAKTLNDVYDINIINSMKTLEAVRLIKVVNDRQQDLNLVGTTTNFTKEQLNYLQTLDYGDNIIFRTEFIDKYSGSYNYSTPHHTIVPDVQAQYSEGSKALKTYFKNQTEAVRKDVDPKQLKAGKLYFTVTKTGHIKNIHLDYSSNYPKVDNQLIKLMQELPGTWIPAKDKNGKTVDQELVVSFGLIGC
ncbi:hypothetical protein [Mesoflavibacter profundi]|uniref:hypothetical protein n=1 Tax=Mesoflavibacter profundi TaxID=2708110 RepID=UPI003516E2A1